MPPAPLITTRLGLQKLGVDNERTFDVFGVVLDAHSIFMLLFKDDSGQIVRFDVIAPLLCVLGLHDDHVSAITALVQ